LKSTIEEALHDDFSREIIRENGMKHVKKNHTLRNRAHQVLEVLNNE